MISYRGVNLKSAQSMANATTVSQHISLKPVDEIPSDCRIRHYDELEADAKAQVPLLTDAPADAAVDDADGATADAFEGCDLVTYTEYYAASAA